MSWNRPSPNTVDATSSSRPAGRGKMPRLRSGLLAGLVVVALGALCYFMFRPSAATPKRDSAKDRGLIKEVVPAAAPKSKEEPKPEKKPEPEKSKIAPWRGKKLTPEQRDALYEKHLAETPLPKASTNRLFRSGLEQVMSWVFTTELGDMPPPLPNIPDFDYVHLQEILDGKNKITKDDSERAADAKYAVDFAKKELKKYVEKGGDPQEFLAYYHDTLKSAYEERKMAQAEVMKVLRTEPELADDYMKKVNESLAQKGIKGVIIPERIRRRVEAEMSQGIQPKENQQ